MFNCRFTAASNRIQPPRDAIQNIENVFVSFKDGITTVKFSHKKDTGDVNDFSLGDSIYFLYAWGGCITNINTGLIEYHGATRRYISDSLNCIPTSVTFCP